MSKTLLIAFNNTTRCSFFNFRGHASGQVTMEATRAVGSKSWCEKLCLALNEVESVLWGLYAKKKHTSSILMMAHTVQYRREPHLRRFAHSCRRRTLPQ
jgi:hypothetical protein